LSFQDKGWNVIAFEGPGQGAVLKEQGAPLTREWTDIQFRGERESFLDG
jgi:hypothetical protein